ncbi:MAG TPA: SDR family oxidoreductase [Sunxiuqinia sp.]|nr:SDR family oxidoreductase [Sunxiuqinia sp.]
MKKILVTGATGHLGGQVLKFLTEKVEPSSLAAISRDPSKLASYKEKGVTVFQADYDDPQSLETAFTGIDALYFVSGSDLFKRMEQHENVVAAAKKAGVKHIVYTSIQRKDETDNSPVALVSGSHLKTEELLKESGMAYTIMKHNLYSEYVPVYIGDQVIDTGVVYFPAGDGKVAFATRTDMAEAGAVVLTTDGHENKSYEISTETAYSFHDIAKMLTEIAGKQINYVSPPVDEFKKTLKDAGVPEGGIEVGAMFAQGMSAGEFNFPDNTLKKLIGHKPEDLSETLQKIYGK